MTSIAFLGIGAMGSRMARNLMTAGFDVIVWNRDSAKAGPLGAVGARIANSPRAAAAEADIVFSMVTDDRASRSVWLDAEIGAIRELRPSATAIEVSTVSPAWIGELGSAVAAKGAKLLDAPVSGSRPQAEAGQLIFMVGGDAVVLDTVRPVFAPMAAKVLHVGPLGQGAVLKLSVNAFFAAQLASVAELLGFLGRSGFGRKEAADLLAQFPIVAPPIASVAKMMAESNSTPQFTIDQIEKDLGYVLTAARAVRAALPGAAAASLVFQEAQGLGLGRANVSGIAAIFK